MFPLAILVFLPGLGEILDLLKALRGDPDLGDARRFLLLPLHSSLSSQDQQLVFKRPPPGLRRARRCSSTGTASSSMRSNTSARSRRSRSVPVWRG